ncbi:TauD/TfdA family dioxygenase [Rhodospirillaceae bacterium SYSU D60014]|uniref:TauD/TfdA dioxygenase family protein n=1 Tax=Virgifigura deserti TaxID=2268457 RepID=UPI000E66423D
MDLEPVAGTIGAEVKGVDLAGPLRDDLAEGLRKALGEHLVLFFRDQQLDVASQKRLTGAFGELMAVPYVEPLADEPYIVAVLKEAGETGISVFGGAWHSDFSFLPRPPGGSVLLGVEVPPFGGDTLWANQIIAYETLPDDLKAVVDGRGAVHVGAPYGVKHAPASDLRLSRSIHIQRGDPEADREVVHPAVRTHPWTGRKALFLNPIYTTRLEGMSAEDSRPLLQRLYEHAVRPEFTCRFRWTPGAVAIWDNRATLHYAINDYDGQRRLMYRTTFAGEEPY